MKTKKLNCLQILFALFVILMPPGSASAGMASNTMALLATIATSVPVLVEGDKALLHQDIGQCLRELRKVFGGDKSAYQQSSNILMNGAEKDRSNLLAICYAFHDEPTALAEHVKELIDSVHKRPTWGKPLYNGTVFTTLPGSRQFLFLDGSGSGSVVQVPIGDFVELNADGHPDYVVAYYSDLPPGGYYRAVYLNVGNGWTMNACDWNMQQTFNNYAFLVVPCPS